MSYYRRFIKNFSKLAIPLTRLLKEQSMCKCNEYLLEDAVWAFEVLKQPLMDEPLLHYVQPRRDFILDVDASQYAIGACLQQTEGGYCRPFGLLF